MFPSTTDGVSSSGLAFGGPMGSSGTESDLQHPSRPLDFLDR